MLPVSVQDNIIESKAALGTKLLNTTGLKVNAYLRVFFLVSFRSKCCVLLIL